MAFHPMTVMVAAYVLPAAVTACTMWTMYLSAVPLAQKVRP